MAKIDLEPLIINIDTKPFENALNDVAKAAIVARQELKKLADAIDEFCGEECDE